MINRIVYNGKIYTNITLEDARHSAIPESLILESLQSEFENKVDTAAGKARSAFVSPGSLVEQEYHLAKQEAQAWLDGGKDETAIPSSVSDHMALFGVGAEAAATEIVATAEQWEQALATIRSARLGGKAAVRNAETVEAAEQAAKAAIAELNAIRPPEGSL